MIFNLMKPIPITDTPTEPTMYLYGHEADKVTTYNGVELPDIESVWTDKETYPYALITSMDMSVAGLNGTLYLLSLCDYAYKYDVNTGYVSFKNDGETRYYYDFYCVPDQQSADSFTTFFGVEIPVGEWAVGEAGRVSADVEISKDGAPLFATYDMLNTDGSVYLAASEPVYTYETADVTIDGIGYVGAVLPELPEWDKETYPYAYIKESYVINNSYTLMLFKAPYALNGTTRFAEFIAVDGETFLKCGHYKNDGWSALTEITADSTDDYMERMVELKVWSNFDLVTEDGSVLLSASEPIPVSE